ncbi:MAG: 30S ribosomal protein S27ae [Nanoarchaeota archaeon]|nr:30S ribosomal protein S27ae [Nanoarchaeota archaeon]
MAEKKPDKGKAVARKPTSKKYKLYEAAGEGVKRKSSFCPKCGVGIFMAQHKDRETCGKCGYTEFKTKS